MKSKNNQDQFDVSDKILNELHSDEQDLYKQLMNSNSNHFFSDDEPESADQSDYSEGNQSDKSIATSQQSVDYQNSHRQPRPKVTTDSHLKKHHYFNFPKSKNNNKESKIWYFVGAIVAIIIIALGVKVWSMPSPTTPKGYANYERSRIVNNIHKNESGITVTSTSTDHQGILKIHTNLNTTDPHKIKQIWNHIYDGRGNPKYDCDNVEVYGTQGMLCESDAQDRHHVNYGNVTQHNNSLPGGKISDDSNED